MINVEALKNKVLDLAMHGKLVAQDPQDEPASALIEKIKEEKAQLIKDKKIKKTKSLSPIEEDEIPYEIPDNWEWVRLGEIVYNYDYRRVPLSLKDRNRLKKVYDYYGASGIIDKVDNYIFDEKLLLIAEDGANLKNRTKDIAFIAEGKYWVNNHAHIVNSIDTTTLYYLKHYINSISLFSYITGSAQPKLNRSNLDNILIPLPPQREQQRIVDKIKDIFAELDKLDEASQKYDECKELLNRRVLDLAMHGKLVAQDSQDEPASALVEKIKEEKAQLIKDKKIKKTKALPPIEEDEIPYEIPDNWEWVRLGEIAEFKLGKTPAKKEAKYWNSSDIPWVSISDLNNAIVSKTERSISKVASKEVFNENIVPKGSLLMSFKLTIGKMGILDMPAYHNEAIISFRLVNDMSNIFRNYLFISLPFFTSFVKTTPAVKGKTLNKKILTNMLIALPPQQEQRRIVDKVEEIFDTLKEI